MLASKLGKAGSPGVSFDFRLSTLDFRKG